MQAKRQQTNYNNKSRYTNFHLLGQGLLPDVLATTWAFRLNIKGRLIAVNVKIGSLIAL